MCKLMEKINLHFDFDAFFSVHYEYSTAIQLQPNLLFILLPTIVMLMLALQSFKD